MERVVLVDPSGKSYKPVWCIAPEAEFTFIYTRGADADLWEKWLSKNPDLLPAQGRLAVRTNACRELNTDGLFLGLMEIDQPATVSVLYAIPASAKAEDLKVVVERWQAGGGKVEKVMRRDSGGRYGWRREPGRDAEHHVHGRHGRMGEMLSRAHHGGRRRVCPVLQPGHARPGEGVFRLA